MTHATLPHSTSFTHLQHILLSSAMRRLAFTMLVLIAAWSLSSFGYFRLLPVLDAEIGYNDAPVFYATYYAIWTAAVFWMFHLDLITWAEKCSPPEDLFLLPILAVIFASFALIALPKLPTIDWQLPGAPEDILSATPWYFLPKSIEILFQQLMIAALVLKLKALKLSTRHIAQPTAALFGVFHLALALNGHNAFYVGRYTVAAVLLGAVVPYLMLQYRNGFLAAYALHWGLYAADIILARFYFAADI
jgi:hypothetical protein